MKKETFLRQSKELKICAIIASNAGIENFKAAKYPEALSNFEKSIQLNEEFLQKTDSNAIYNAALSAEKSQNYDKAIQYFQKSIDINYGGKEDGPLLYSLLAESY
jgi:tetratricopeptide (TPR) repeat protein